MRSCASFRYFGSISLAIEFRPEAYAANVVEQVPAKGSSTMSPANENIRINRSASSFGNGAGWPARVDDPLISVQNDWNHDCISSFVNIDNAFCTGDGER